jgi:hypothetical protein
MKADKNVFPYELQNSNGKTTVYTGLTIRDYIAIQAMAGLSANTDLTRKGFDEIADMAYKQADAMIERSGVKDE